MTKGQSIESSQRCIVGCLLVIKMLHLTQSIIHLSVQNNSDCRKWREQEREAESQSEKGLKETVSISVLQQEKQSKRLGIWGKLFNVDVHVIFIEKKRACL